MRRPSRAAVVIALMVVCGAADRASADEPTKQSLLAAWEASQRADPETLLFENVEADRYRFATDRFPFDGVVRVLNVVLDDRHVEYADGFVLGMVEVKLEDAGDEFLRDHAYSIGVWQAGNTFYFDRDAGLWLDAAQWQRRVMDQYPTGGVWSWLYGGLFWVVFLVILVALLWWIARKANRQMNWATAAQDRALAEQARAIEMTEEMLEIARDSNRTLHHILAQLQGRDADSGHPEG